MSCTCGEDPEVERCEFCEKQLFDRLNEEAILEKEWELLILDREERNDET